MWLRSARAAPHRFYQLDRVARVSTALPRVLECPLAAAAVVAGLLSVDETAR